MPSPLVSIVIPVFNEESILLKNVETLSESFDRIVGPDLWGFIFVNNGSTDQTANLLEEVTRRLPLTRVIFEQQPNYGLALRAGLRAVETPFAHPIDIEQWDLIFFEWAWKQRDSFDLFIGSKRADPTINHQPAYRWLLSWGLNALLQLFFSYTGTETHGPKLIRMERVKPLLDLCILDRGQFDTEVVLRSSRAGLRIIEAPVVHVEHRPARNLMLKKIFWNLRAFYRLRKVMVTVPFEGPTRHYRVAREDVLAAVAPAQGRKLSDIAH